MVPKRQRYDNILTAGHCLFLLYWAPDAARSHLAAPNEGDRAVILPPIWEGLTPWDMLYQTQDADLEWSAPSDCHSNHAHAGVGTTSKKFQSWY